MTASLYQRSRLILQNEQLPPEQLQNLLTPVGFIDWEAAYKNLKKIAAASPQSRTALARGLPALLQALANVASPNRVLISFERFVLGDADPAQLLTYLANNPRSFEILTTLFSGSQFLTEILLRNPNYFEPLVDHRNLSQTKSLEELKGDAVKVIQPWLAQADITPALDALRRFQRYELLRIGVCDLLGLLDVATVTMQLSHLADSLAHAAIRLAAHHTGADPAGFGVLGMGKLGGQELNYSSDIDLIFLCHTEAQTYIKMGQAFIDILARSTAEGFLYRVDMRLRPWGKSGALVSPVDSYITYLAKHAGLWERQALLKARLIAGDETVGQAFFEQVEPIIFDHHGNIDILRPEIHKLKQRIEAQLKLKGRGWGEVKLGQGSIRDIEFVTQYLQLVHGPTEKLYTPNTLKALAALLSGKHIRPDEYRVLADGYVFLRTIEHHLQLMHYRQTHTLPTDPAALNSLARRLGFQGAEAGVRFTGQYQQHSAVIRAVYQRHLADEIPAPNDSPISPETPDVLPLLTRMHPSYVTTFSDEDIERHARLIETLDKDNLVSVIAEPLDSNICRVTIVGHDYLGALSQMCGLFVAHGLDIVRGSVYTYGPDPNESPVEEPKRSRWNWGRRKAPPPKPWNALPERKIVDVFEVTSVHPSGPCVAIEQDTWRNYAADLEQLFQRLHRGLYNEAQGELAKRVALAVPRSRTGPTALYPVDIRIDNEISERHTVLQIGARDTFGFLYEFTNALALARINIRHMTVASHGNQVNDVLHVTDAKKEKITAPEKQRELRVAAVLIKHFTHLLPQSPNPESAMRHFREFVAQLFTRPNWPDELTSLEEPEVLHTLARLLGVSDFLWNDFLRMQHANLFPVVKDTHGLAEPISKGSLREELAIILQNTPKGQPQHDALNAFKDREMFRIDMRRIQGHITGFGQFSTELTALAEVVVEAAYQMVNRDLLNLYGPPRLENGNICPVSICALGKCGGAELGFASDIELMFIFAGPGRTSGHRVITNAEYFTKLVQDVSQTIQTRLEGIFELDLRLRPYGGAGSMAVSIDSFESYFSSHGDAWPYERQALVKLRPICGDMKFGQQVVRLRDHLIYTEEPFDVAAMRAMRERQIRHLVKAGTFHAKFSPGGLVDVEYLVQGLQITYGHLDPGIRTPNTRQAMKALAAMKIIPDEDYPRLQEAYSFLRNLINALRMVRGNAKDLTVPNPDDEAFAFLARRLEYGDDLIKLQNDIYRHTNFIRKRNLRLLGG
jgi:glutamate-ammonia-ligase adenylyltransferase